MKYKHLFFDLDHTLWDFDHNSSESLMDVFEELGLQNYGVESPETFVTCFLRINASLWEAFDQGKLHHTYIRENRFRLVFEKMGLECPPIHREIGELYLNALPQKKKLLEGAIELLDHVTAAGYQLHIITNGFDEIQAKKIANSQITHYFRHMITFESANAKKPDRRIFEFALEKAGTTSSESLMIGDNWLADIIGARSVGMDAAYLNPAGLRFEETPTYDIRRLQELILIL